MVAVQLFILKHCDSKVYNNFKIGCFIPYLFLESENYLKVQLQLHLWAQKTIYIKYFDF